MSWRLELDSRDNLSASRSIVSARTGDAVPQVTEAVGNASIAVILSFRRRISHIQAGICPAVEDVEEVRADREPQTVLHCDGLADAQLFAGVSRTTEVSVVWLGSSVGSRSRFCPRIGVEEERGLRVDIVFVEAMQEELLAGNAVQPNAIGKSHRRQIACRSRCLDREAALVMEDAVGGADPANTAAFQPLCAKLVLGDS